MFACDTSATWMQFLEFVKKGCSPTAFDNWLSPIRVLDATEESITLEVPNVFVKEYLLSNYKKDLCAFLPVDANGEPAIEFVITKKDRSLKYPAAPPLKKPEEGSFASKGIRLNKNYRFETFIEGPTNHFVKSAAMGVSVHPGRSYNPLFIWGGVGLGKTHILHSIGHYVQEHHRSLRVQCITTEAFINDLVNHLRSKSVDRMKRFYRSSLDLLLVDDIQFLQNRLNFEEELCHTFEALMNQGKQIVITSDKPPSQLKLSERLVGRMEWGLVVNLGIPELETRVAILQHKAEQKGLLIPHEIAFYIAQQIQNNVRQLEGAVNRLSAQCRLMNMEVCQSLVEKILGELLQETPQENISIDLILRSVAAIFEIRVNDIRGASRKKEIALARQVAMYLAKRLIDEPCIFLATAFGKTHSTLLHACQTIEKKREKSDTLRRQIDLVLGHIKKTG